MIIWLASYPRSGNTLTRSLLKMSMGLHSYSQHKMVRKITSRDINEYGILDHGGSWSNFYSMAHASKETYLIKTHSLPIDNSPVIYIVRDGRLATESYLTQYQDRLKKAPGVDAFLPNYFDLAIGRDYYSDWSNHYHAWVSNNAKSKVLQLRYEDICEPTTDVLKQIADFVGYTGEIKPFINQIIKPRNGIERGQATWQRPEHRTEIEESLFLSLHGELMLQLGYIEQAELDLAVSSIDDNLLNLSTAALSCARERFQWMQAAIEKEAVIERLLDNKTTNSNSFIKKLVRYLK